MRISKKDEPIEKTVGQYIQSPEDRERITKEFEQEIAGGHRVVSGTKRSDQLVREIPLTLIDPDPDQPRKTMKQEALEQLANSLNTIGLKQLVVVRPHPTSPDRYMLLIGHRRIRAAQLAGWESIAAVVEKDGGSRADTLRDQIAENSQREDIDPFEMGTSLQRFMDTTELSQSGIAKELGLNRTHVVEFLSLNNIPKKLRKRATDAGVDLPKRAWVELARFEGTNNDRDALLKDMMTSKAPWILARDTRRKAKPPNQTPKLYSETFEESDLRITIKSVKHKAVSNARKCKALDAVKDQISK